MQVKKRSDEGGEGEGVDSDSDNEDCQTTKSNVFEHNNLISEKRRGRGRRGDEKGGTADIGGRGSESEGRWQ